MNNCDSSGGGRSWPRRGDGLGTVAAGWVSLGAVAGVGVGADPVCRSGTDLGRVRGLRHRATQARGAVRGIVGAVEASFFHHEDSKLREGSRRNSHTMKQ